MSYGLSDLMQLLVSERGEAVHLHDKEAPVLEIGRELHRIEGPSLEPGDTHILLQEIAQSENFQEALRGCTVFEHPFWDHDHKVARFQVMAFNEDGSIRLELRRLV